MAMTAGIISCATLRQLSFERPEVALNTIEISGLDLDGVDLVLWLDVHNPNDYEIETTRIEATLDLEGTHFGSADGVGAAVRALLGRGTVNYELDTRLRIQTSLGGRSVSFQHRGEVQVKDVVR